MVRKKKVSLNMGQNGKSTPNYNNSYVMCENSLYIDTHS